MKASSCGEAVMYRAARASLAESLAGRSSHPNALNLTVSLGFASGAAGGERLAAI